MSLTMILNLLFVIKWDKPCENCRLRLGIYAVLGNHEYYGGHVPAFVEQMEQIGIRVLMDEVVHIQERLYIVGRKDKTAEHAAKDVSRSLRYWRAQTLRSRLSSWIINRTN